MMKAAARRLLGAETAVRPLVLLAASTAVAGGLLAVIQASVLAGVLASGFQGRLDTRSVVLLLGLLAALIGLRALIAGAHLPLAAEAAATAKANLREKLLSGTLRLGPGWLAGRRSGELVTLATRGLDALEPYFTDYLPRLVLAGSMPVAVLIRLVWSDPLSAAIVAGTLPLLVIFGALIGMGTRDASERQWETLARLGGHFLDLVAGLPTLRALGRASAQAGVLWRVAHLHRAATMRTLRVAFLSALVLELVTALSVALLAVPIGLRLLAGQMDLQVGLLVLLVAPEAYLSVRAVGAGYHASAQGIAAAERAFALLDEAADQDMKLTPPGLVPAPEPMNLRLDRVTVSHRGEDGTALQDLTLVVRDGERVALIGPSGAGKSTVLLLLLGLLRPSAGRVLVGGVDLQDLDLEAWRRRIAWVPQRPHLFATTIADNIRLGDPQATQAQVRRAAEAAAADEFIARLPAGYETMLGERGHGLSAGQRQRIALARVFLRDPELVLLDEPTSHLDAGSEAAVLHASERLLTSRTVLLVAHRPALLEAAERWVRLEDGRIAAEGAVRRAQGVPA